MRKSLFLPLAALLLAAPAATAQLTVRTVADNLFIPWELAPEPGAARIWFTQKNGYICRLTPATGLVDTVYHEPATVIQSEGGMLGLALHPDFSNGQPYVYSAYNYLQGGNYRERIVRYTWNGTALGAPLTLLDNLNAANFHNGCRLLIAGDKLFITTGDATNMPLSQNDASLSGKVLRINLDGSIPQDNPWPGSAVWSKGHRNPQGLAMSAAGTLYSSEHGANSDDEINIIRKGRNFGWPNVEGFCNTAAEQTFCTDSNVAEPLRAWTPTLAVSGIALYNGSQFPAWQHSLLMATLKDQRLYQLQLNAAGDAIQSATVVPQVAAGRLRAVCVLPDGKVYLSTSNSVAAGTGARVDKILELYDPSVPTSVGSIAATGGLKAWPNPAATELVVEGAPAGARVELVSAEGRVLGQSALSGGRLDVSALPAGLYLLRLEDGRSLRFSKISGGR